MQLLIRRFRPSDKDAVLTIFSTSFQEHIGRCFHNAMTSPLYLAITPALCVAGYLLGSVLGAVVLPGVWVGLIYCCCHKIYDGYAREKLRTDMQDIPGNYLSRPDDCFWVAEAEADGRAQIVGMVGVVGKRNGEEKNGKLFRMIVSPSFRRMGLGFRMGQTVLDFCKERGFSEVVLGTSTSRTPAVALYKKLGFRQVPSHNQSKALSWFYKLAKAITPRLFPVSNHLITILLHKPGLSSSPASDCSVPACAPSARLPSPVPHPSVCHSLRAPVLPFQRPYPLLTLWSPASPLSTPTNLHVVAIINLKVLLASVSAPGSTPQTHAVIYYITEGLTWALRTGAVVRNERQRLLHFKRLRKFCVSPQILRNFFSCTMGSVLFGNITAWLGNSMQHDQS